MNILEQIIADKYKEVALKKSRIPVDAYTTMPLFNAGTKSLKTALQTASSTGIIAEFKRRSPSKGIINANADVAQVAAAYSQHAAGISILTDGPYFGGTNDDLIAAGKAAIIPLLRKDFIIDKYQLYEARAIGADVILLIAANLSVAEVKRLAQVAKSLQLEVLLEIHNEQELDHICDEVDLVGVNNRNLKTFEVNITTSLELINKMPGDKPAIAESGISNVDTIVTLRQAGFKGFLIGENFMKHTDPSIAFTDFINELKAKTTPCE